MKDGLICIELIVDLIDLKSVCFQLMNDALIFIEFNVDPIDLIGRDCYLLSDLTRHDYKRVNF